MQDMTVSIVFLCVDLVLLFALFFLGVYVKKKISVIMDLYDISKDLLKNVRGSLEDYDALINLAKGVVKHMDDTTSTFQKLIDQSDKNLTDVLIDEIKPRKTRVKKKSDDGAAN